MANWRDTTPDDLKLSPLRKAARGERSNWRPILLVLIGALLGLLAGELRLRSYQAAVDSSFATAQGDVKRLADERAHLLQQLQKANDAEKTSNRALDREQTRTKGLQGRLDTLEEHTTAIESDLKAARAALDKVRSEKAALLEKEKTEREKAEKEKVEREKAEKEATLSKPEKNPPPQPVPRRDPTPTNPRKPDPAKPTLLFF